MLPLREIDVMGILVAPFALCIPIAVAGTYGMLLALRRLPAGATWTRGPTVELTLFIGSPAL